MPPTRASKHLDRDCHSPRVFKNNRGAEVDVWGVGKLIIDAGKFAPGISAGTIAVGEKMLQGQTTTAKEALVDMKKLLSLFFPIPVTMCGPQ